MIGYRGQTTISEKSGTSERKLSERWLCIMFAKVSQKLECSVASNTAERPRELKSSEPYVTSTCTYFSH